MKVRPYSAQARKTKDGHVICVCSKRKGKLLPITSGTLVPTGQEKVTGTYLAALTIELGKAGVEVVPRVVS